MKLQRGHWFVIIFNLIYVAIFGYMFLQGRNLEFIGYVGVLLFFAILIATTLEKSKLPLFILWGLSLWGFMHLAGGAVIVGENVLYRYEIIHILGSGDSFILKFDQFVHFFGFGVTALVVHHLLKNRVNNKVSKSFIYFIAIISAMGLGALNEMIEFFASVVAPQTGVGTYTNNSIDLYFNALGAIVAMIFVHFKEKLRRH